jgi:uncharacterized membrane protein YeiB
MTLDVAGSGAGLADVAVPAGAAAPAVERAAEGRLDGLDVARALAILGMFCVHAVLVLSQPLAVAGASAFVFALCDGRAAALFVALAGIGVERFLASGDATEQARTLRRRALFLGVVGVLNLIVWPGDILRVYGVALVLAPVLRRLPDWALVAAAATLVALFPPIAEAVVWESRWNFATLDYRGLWEPVGFVRNLMIDGFRPVVPWLSFFLLGMWLGRQDLRSARVQGALAGAGALALAATETASQALVGRLIERAAFGGDTLVIEAVAGTGSLPPMPLFMLAAAATTALALGACLWSASRLPGWLVRACVATGRRSLTWYLLHIVLLVGAWVAGLGTRFSPEAALLCAALAFLAAVVVSALRDGAPGPFERALRAFAAQGRG